MLDGRFTVMGAGGGVEADLAGGGGGDTGGQLEELADAASLFTDDADDSAIGGGDGNLM